MGKHAAQLYVILFEDKGMRLEYDLAVLLRNLDELIFSYRFEDVRAR